MAAFERKRLMCRHFVPMLVHVLLWILNNNIRPTSATHSSLIIHISQQVHVSRNASNHTHSGQPEVTQCYSSHPGIPLHVCTRRCQLMTACHFVNYHVSSHTCVIVRHVDTTRQATIERVTGYILGIKAEWTLAVDPVCQSCNLSTICNVTTVTPECQVIACGVPVIPDRAVANGNVYTTGSRVSVTCQPDMVATPGGNHSVTCQESGAWSSLALTCAPVTTTTTTSTTSTTTTTTTTTTTPTTPAAEVFSCHSEKNVFKTALLSDNTVITYRVSSNNDKEADEAATKCTQYGGSLLKITSMARFYFASALTQCRAFGKDYWIDAWRGSNGFFTSDGQPVPMSNQVWSNAEGSTRCARIDGDDGKLNDKNCDSELYYICEI